MAQHVQAAVAAPLHARMARALRKADATPQSVARISTPAKHSVMTHSYLIVCRQPGELAVLDYGMTVQLMGRITFFSLWTHAHPSGNGKSAVVITGLLRIALCSVQGTCTRLHLSARLYS